jgi:hypothetical protein
MFYDPEGLISHQKQLDRDRIRSAEEKKNQKATEEEQAVLASPKYYPLRPEIWKKDFL